MARYEILCVDHDALVRHIIAHEIEEAGHFVMSTGSGTAALAMLAKNPTIDLVLVDYCLPDMAGEKLIHKIKSGWPKMKVALLTGYEGMLHPKRDDCSEISEAYPVIAKNARMEEILCGIEAAAKGEPRRPAQNSLLTRAERLTSNRPSRAKLENLQRQLQSLYEKTIPETLAKPFSRFLGRSGEAVFSETRR